MKIEPAFGVELNEPYFNENRWVSGLNWLPEVREQMNLPKKVHIHDVTLRDGEQTARIAFTPEEKILIATELDKLGVHSIEPGLPATPEDREVIEQLAGMDLNAKIVPLARVMEGDVRAAIDAKADGILLEFGINPYLLKHVYNNEPDRLVKEIAEFAEEGKRQGMYVEFMGWDVLRIPDMDYIERFFSQVAEHAPVDRITIADTFGMGHPLTIYHLISKLREWTGKSIGFHIHNDYGMATANSLMAVSAGADMVHTAVNGLGERAGNVSTEEMALVLQHLLDIDAGIDLSRLKPLSDLVTEISKAEPARNKPVVGSGLFEVESGIVVHLLKSLEGGPLKSALFPYMPETVGHDPYKIVFGRGTGVHAVKRLLSERGIDASDEQVLELTNKIKEMGLRVKNGIPDSMMKSILEEQFGK